MHNNKPRYYKKYYEIKSSIEEYLYHHETIAFICGSIAVIVITIILSILSIILTEILLFGVN